MLVINLYATGTITIFRQARGFNLNIKLFYISLRETTVMTIESIQSRESYRGYL